MIWYLLGAAVSLGAIDWSGGGGSRRFWITALAALAAFGLALTLPFPAGGSGCPPNLGAACRAGFLLFLGLFLLATALMGAGSLYRRLSAGSLIALALSDLCLILAVRAFHAQTSGWVIPAPGGWGSASSWGAAAALLRMAVPAAASRGSGLNEAGLSCLAWWQGALLAWWVGAPGGIVLVLGGMALWPAAAAFGRTPPAALAAAGGLAAIGAALSAPPAGLAGTGLAGLALVLGEPVIGIWALAVLPFSLLTSAGEGSTLWASAAFGGGRDGIFGLFLLACTLLAPMAWSVSALTLKSSPGQAQPQGKSPIARRAGLLASSLALGAIVSASALSGPLIWAVVGAGLSLVVSHFLLGEPLAFRRALASLATPAARFRRSFGADEQRRLPPASNRDITGSRSFWEGPAGGFAHHLARTAPAWAVLLIVLSMFVWLVFVGLQTQFL